MDLEFRTVPAELRHWATTDPDTPAFIFVDAAGGRCVLTRADLFRLSSRYAAMLRQWGVQAGHTVCNTLPNSPERLLTDLGVLLAGGVAMNGQLFLADGDDFVGSLKDAACFAVILDPRQPKGAARVLEKRKHTQHGSEVRYWVCRTGSSRQSCCVALGVRSGVMDQWFLCELSYSSESEVRQLC